ncbi:hypothetical protein AB4Z18_10630 [Leifsonia sp. 2TAF2]|uniref:hypothetical protein n=1 Tax=Leifsonia sp. 2TAF2 TaxID=3233009 RepID=UPI003F94F47C
MRKIAYAGTTFYTGDDLAEALMEYARALARHDIADTIFVPGRTVNGELDRIEMLVGPASQIVSEPIELVGPEIRDEELVAKLGALTAELSPRKPTAEPADGSADGVRSHADDLG